MFNAQVQGADSKLQESIRVTVSVSVRHAYWSLLDVSCKPRREHSVTDETVG